jgi:hypothetical protein
VGTLVRASGGSGGTQVAVRWVSEVNGRVRLEEQSGGNTRVLGFDGNRPWLSAGNIAAADLDLLETLLNDTPEYFFFTQATNVATRFLGARFRFDDGRRSDYRGPYYDVYQVSDRYQYGANPVTRLRTYCLNSDTLVLDRVQYVVSQGATRTLVETVLSEWKEFQGQAFPTRVVRMEDGRAVLTFSLNAVTTQAGAKDGIFNPPGNP